MRVELKLIAIAIPVFYLTMLLEWLWIHKISPNRFKNAKGYTVRDTVASLSMVVGYLGVASIWKLALVPLYYLFYEFRIFDIPLEGWQWWALLVVLQDFAYYWFHRLHHEIRMMWASHVNHHSSEHYNLSTALRQSWTSMFTAMPFSAPLIFLGFHPTMLFLVELLNLFYQYWIHTETVGHMGPFEKVLMTPSHHRVHHGAMEPYLDKNYGGFLIIWDRIFGTFEPEAGPVIYGLTKNIQTYNPVRIAFHEWAHLFRDVKNAESFADAWGYVFNKPGWKPEPSRVSTQSLESSGL